MKKIAIIGASYLQRPLVERAKQMGYYTLCFAWADGAVCAEIADEFHDISIVEKEAILDVCRRAEIAGVCTIASDVAAPTVAYVAAALGLPGNDYEAAVRANNKHQMREAFSAAGIPCPQYRYVRSADEDLSDLSLPLIVKPTDRSGSAGVTKVEEREQLRPAIEVALETSFGHEAMVEEFVEGREISVEFISYAGQHYPLQITDKVTTEAPHFVELAHHQPSTLSPEMYRTIYDTTRRALDALGLTYGASHSEYKITAEGRIAVMEIGGRMGGDFIGSDLVRLSTGYDYVRGVIEVATGDWHEPELPQQNHAGVYFLCEETKALLPYITDAIRRPDTHPEVVAAEITDEHLQRVSRSADRSGYVIYQAKEKLELL